MSLINFPSHIQPARVSVSLRRVDETVASPLTNVQQVISRGNPAWQWTYEYVDLTDDQREVIQAFILNCRGSLNTFKVRDPADYGIRGSMSDWIDVFSGYGSFTDASINSWFKVSTVVFDEHITDEQTLRLQWKRHAAQTLLKWRGHGGALTVNSFEAGCAYAQRIKHFQQADKLAHGFELTVGSGGNAYNLSTIKQVQSSDNITVPIYMPFHVIDTHAPQIIDWTVAGGCTGDAWDYADYRLARCALVANSENLFTQSNNFGHADWITVGASVASGYSDYSPIGVQSGSWKLFTSTDVNTAFYIHQSITTPNTEDIYTFALYAKSSELEEVMLILQSQGSANSVGAVFYLSSGTSALTGVTGPFERPYAKIWTVGSGFYRCQLTTLVSSSNTLQAIAFISSGGSLAFNGNGSDGIEIMGAQLRRFPFMGPYVPTTDTIVVGSGWQTGSKLHVDGFDAEDVIKAGQRFEIVNRFHNVNSNYSERSEFKRVTRETKASLDGHAIVEFDPPIRNAPITDRSDKIGGHLGHAMHDPVMFHKPEMKARLVNGTIQYVDKPLKSTDIIFDVIEDMTS